MPTTPKADSMNEQCVKYLKQLKDYEPELTQEMRAIARESFTEGWIACERALGRL